MTLEPTTLRLESVSKSFQGVRALDGVGLDLVRGEVHALLGQNGSGKSTLIKILAGYHRPDTGRAWRDGEEMTLGSASSALHAGLRFIHQDRGLVPDLDLAENIALGQSYGGTWWVSDRDEWVAARRDLASLGLELDPDRLARTLTPIEETMVAVTRALRGEITRDTILVLDEPTATLPEEESARLFGLVRSIKMQGGTVLYVTHRLREVFEIGDRVTVLRDGKRVATERVDSLTEDELIERIVGRRLDVLYTPPPTARQEIACEARGLVGGQVRDASFKAHKGEILGVTGIAGSGQNELLQMLFGAIPKISGEIRIDGRLVSVRTPRDAIRAGIAFAPADRKRLSAIPTWTLSENVTLPMLKPRRLKWARWLKWLGTRSEEADARKWLERLDVTPGDPDRVFATLSGGNQQRVVLARWLRCEPGVLLLEEPTGGVDIGAKQGIYAALAELATSGTAVVLSSSDAEELAAICDRVLVMREGTVVAELTGDLLTVDHIIAESIREGTPQVSQRERS